MAYTRMCWYSDTPDSDFVIDYAPGYDNMLIASGGSGHAFKVSVATTFDLTVSFCPLWDNSFWLGWRVASPRTSRESGVLIDLCRRSMTTGMGWDGSPSY